jgi:ABC-type transport system involved in multi-copper enzyme maturation permease subunit
MTRALLWKEWRTQRSLVLAGLAIAAVLPPFLMAGAMATSSRYRFGDLVAALPPLFALLVWPLFAAATGATAFAADRSDDSLRFLLSRPVSRGRVWLIKAGSALAAFLAVVAGTMLIGALYTWSSSGAIPGLTATIAASSAAGSTTRWPCGCRSSCCSAPRCTARRSRGGRSPRRRRDSWSLPA